VDHPPSDLDPAESIAVDRNEVTQLLGAWRAGDASALDRLIPLVYGELRKVAQRHMQGEEGSTLQATALVNEAYLRMVDLDVPWNGRVHFFAVAAGLMRRILVDRARRRRALKRGSGIRSDVEVDALPGPAHDASPEELIALDHALEQLTTEDERKAKVIELRLFGELTIPETAEALGLSTATVERDLKMAKAWLVHRLRTPPGG
jgi:RNA polymerase sigma-70 factor (ECF subfamily)